MHRIAAHAVRQLKLKILFVPLSPCLHKETITQFVTHTDSHWTAVSQLAGKVADNSSERPAQSFMTASYKTPPATMQQLNNPSPIPTIY